MPVTLTWQQIALRLLLATLASFLIGFDRDEHGKTAGIRTTMLVCLAATLAMLQANLLMNSTGKAHDSFVVLDLMRNPLGILTGIGFLGAGAILRKDGLVHGLTTAATIWFTTVLGLLFGGGQLILASTATVLVLLILWGLKYVEIHLPKQRRGTLHITFTEPSPDTLTPDDTLAPDEATLRNRLKSSGYTIATWVPHYCGAALHSLECEVNWPSRGKTAPDTPPFIRELAAAPATASLIWRA